MKKISKFVIGAIAIGILSFNLALNDGKSISNTTLENISAMQASAYSEMFCDLQNSTLCEIVYADQIVFGIGFVRVLSDD